MNSQPLDSFSLRWDDFSAINPYAIIISPDFTLLKIGTGYGLESKETESKKLYDAFVIFSLSSKEFDSKDPDTYNDCLIYRKGAEYSDVIRGRFSRISEMIVFNGYPLKSHHENIKLKVLLYFNKLVPLVHLKYEKPDLQRLFLQFINTKYLNELDNFEKSYGVTLSDRAGNIVWCNDHFIAFAGKKTEDILGKRPREAIYGNASVYVPGDFVDKMVAKGEPFYFENVGHNSSWFGATVFPIFDKDNKNIGRIHMISDVSERKLLDIQLEQQGYWLALTIESANVGLWTLDTKSLDVEATGKFKELLGFSSQTEISFSSINCMLEKNGQAETVRNCINKISVSNPSCQIDQLELTIKDVVSYFKVNAKCILFSHEGQPVKLVGTITNVTEQVKTEQEIAAQREFFRKILNDLPAEVVIVSTDYKYKFINKYAIKDDELRQWMIDKDDFDFYKQRNLDLEIPKIRRKHLQEAIAQKKEIRFLEYFEKSEKYSLRLLQPTFNNQDGLEYVIGYGLDVTEQMRAIVKEKELNQQKSRFINITSHELRTPLTIIYSNAELLQMIYQNETFNVHIDRILKEVDSMTDILNELMIVNKIEKGEVEVSKSTVDVEKYIQDITYLFRPYRDGRTLELEIAPEASDWYFDDKLLKYAVTNILTNAFKYSRNKKSPELKVFVEEGSLKIRVKDYGIGIPKSDIRDIFKTFYRASNVGTIQGTGIGLMIVEYAVKKHNGRVEIDSETGRGTVVTLTIP